MESKMDMAIEDCRKCFTEKNITVISGMIGMLWLCTTALVMKNNYMFNVGPFSMRPINANVTDSYLEQS